jgi:hypothetical protein
LIDLHGLKDGPPVDQETATGLLNPTTFEERQPAMSHESLSAQYLPKPSDNSNFPATRPGGPEVAAVSSSSATPIGSSAPAASVPQATDSAAKASMEPSERTPSGGNQSSDLSEVCPLRVPEPNRSLQLNQRPAEVVRIAVEVFAMTSSWVDFYRAILGPEGVARKLFHGADQNRFWESTPEFFQIQEMLTAIRSHDDLKSDSVEPLRMITIRLPMSMHEALKLESNERNTSINKLCLSKLLNGIDQKLVPQEKGRIRGRKPGPQGKRSPAQMP